MRKTHVVALLVCLLSAGCSKSSNGGGGTPTTPTPNRPPTIGSMTVTPTFGVSELTTFAYTASASDPDGDPVSYSWDFAGNTLSGSNGTIVFSGSGTGEVTLSVTDGRGGTSKQTLTITVGSMTGNWLFSMTGYGTLNMTYTQSSTLVTGTFVVNAGGFGNAPAGMNGRTDPAEPGRIDGNGNVRVRLKIGDFIDFTFTGVMDSTGRRVTGSVTGSGFSGQPFTMTKQ